MQRDFPFCVTALWTLKNGNLPHTRVRSVTSKPFKIYSWNFTQMLSNMRGHAEHSNSGLHTFGVIALWTLKIAISTTYSCPLCNMKTPFEIFMCPYQRWGGTYWFHCRSYWCWQPCWRRRWRDRLLYPQYFLNQLMEFHHICLDISLGQA